MLAVPVSADPSLSAPADSSDGADAGTGTARAYQRLRDKAYRLLARREHSAWELRRKLQARPMARSADDGGGRGRERPDPELIEQLLTELAEQGAQSDHRFTEQRCRHRFQSGRGPVKLRHELAQHQIEESLVAQAMAVYDGKWRECATQARCRKFGEQPPATYAEWARQARFLQQRGFASEQIEPYSG